ncbi:MAG TPA: hypothetical protein VH500_03235 [Nitrososphaeraceae archaeon]
MVNKSRSVGSDHFQIACSEVVGILFSILKVREAITTPNLFVSSDLELLTESGW